MAANYTDLKLEIQTWLDRSDTELVAAIPTMIQDAENGFDRVLRTWEMECSRTTPLVPNGVTDDTRGIYPLPGDWLKHKTVRIHNTELRIIFYGEIPKLTDQSQTNWLLSKHSDLYRFASLVSAESWLKNDPRIEVWRKEKDRAIAEIVKISAYESQSGGPKRIRTTNDRQWKLMRSTNGSLQYINTHDFFDIKESGFNKTQLGMSELGYFTTAYGRIHIWPEPQGDPTGDQQWTVCP